MAAGILQGVLGGKCLTTLPPGLLGALASADLEGTVHMLTGAKQHPGHAVVHHQRRPARTESLRHESSYSAYGGNQSFTPGPPARRNRTPRGQFC